MQIKKEILLFCLLIVLSASLLIAADVSTNNSPCSTSIQKGQCCNCCQERMKAKAESPWNFITSGILHLSV